MISVCQTFDQQYVQITYIINIINPRYVSPVSVEQVWVLYFCCQNLKVATSDNNHVYLSSCTGIGLKGYSDQTIL